MHKPELLIIGLDGAMISYVCDAVAAGRLPNFKRIIDRGVVCDNCMTAFPSITPTCWTTIATGAAPAITNAVDHEIHIPGTELDQFVNGYDPAYLKGERFWEAAVRAGKTALIASYPALPSYPEDSAIWTLDAQGVVQTSVKHRFFHINFDGSDTGTKQCRIAFRDGAGTWMPVENAPDQAEDAGDGIYLLAGIADLDKQPGKLKFRQFTWTLRFEDGGVRLGENAETLCTPVKSGDWTPVIARKLSCEDGSVRTMYFQGKVLSYDPETNACEMFISAANPAEEIAAPEAFRKLVGGISGNTDSSPYHFIIYDNKDNASYAEGFDKHADWKFKLIEKAMEARSTDILVYYEGFIDTVNHIYRPAFENLSGGFTEPVSHVYYTATEDVSETMRKQHEKAVDMYARVYDLADKIIGRLLDKYADEHTTVVLLSDHGGVGNTKEYQACRCFEAEGLTVRNDDGSIDWSKTVAYSSPVTSGHAFVNLKGRDPHGVVEPENYDAVVARMIEVLNRTSEGSMAFILDRREADLVGQGGDSMCGDVIYGMRGGEYGGYVGGIHAAQSPSAKTKTGDIRSMFIASGPVFRKGVKLHRLMDETDIAPTVNYAMGYPLPADATGGIITQALEKTII